MTTEPTDEISTERAMQVAAEWKSLVASRQAAKGSDQRSAYDTAIELKELLLTLWAVQELDRRKAAQQ